MKKQTNGAKFDALQVEKLTEVLKNQMNDKKDAETFIKNLYQSFCLINQNNPFYKNTPTVFRSLTVFYVQAVKAMKQAGLKTNIEDALSFLYTYTVCMALSPCPDVNKSEAGRILRAINFSF